MGVGRSDVNQVVTDDATGDVGARYVNQDVSNAVIGLSASVVPGSNSQSTGGDVASGELLADVVTPDQATRRQSGGSGVMRSTPRVSTSSRPRVHGRGGDRGGRSVQFVSPSGLTHTTTRSGRQVRAPRDKNYKYYK